MTENLPHELLEPKKEWHVMAVFNGNEIIHGFKETIWFQMVTIN